MATSKRQLKSYTCRSLRTHLVSKSTTLNNEFTQNSEGCSNGGRKYKFLIPVKVKLGTNPNIPLD